MRLSLTCATFALTALAGAPANAESAFNRVATFPVAANLPADRDAGKATVAEIIAASPDGMLLIYTDSPQEAVGLVDIADPRMPEAGRLHSARRRADLRHGVGRQRLRRCRDVSGQGASRRDSSRRSTLRARR